MLLSMCLHSDTYIHIVLYAWPSSVCCVFVHVCLCAQSANLVSVFDLSRWMGSPWTLSPSALLSVRL